ncbi:putative redox protein, regulator of disulfide bond formation [Caldisphaera lagunensis DSM 15908]|uniref:Putative redox protein, regulator of disulfide bond formation n=1 Tax=Caldisphaera lagunensis (strain DSM 15908 / JCM 11604 / ANMR 0165 / IC-154) TaxID=1056495 RepID=L0ACP0_CALLD|nr:sulfurtransferase TusA family protein [Caldisphaera lagunensis]AFZ71194.1 putative redox protein, regulator of disulfide bond formation [Caldisphaera lagunensis DSM 15908]
MSESGKKVVDARGLSCPGPITNLTKVYRNAKNGDVLEIWATDPGFKSDIKAWIERTKNELIELKEDKDKIVAVIKITAKK